MFNTSVRSKLEYASQVWNPYTLEDIDLLENVQRKSTKRLRGLRNIPYPNRLDLMDVKPLELRRLEADLIYVYKLLHGQIDTDYHKFFELKTSITRGHNYTLKKNNFHKDVYRYFFANRTTNTVKQETLVGINFGEKPNFIQLADINFGEKQTSWFLLWRKADQHSVKF